MKVNIEKQTNGIELVKIENASSKIIFTNYGARIVNWKFDDNNIVLGNEVEADEFYPHNPFYFGATVGRYGGRIENGTFQLNGVTYQLEQNDPPHHLHGGAKGASRQLFDYDIEEAEDYVKVIFHTKLRESEDHFPGDIDLKVIFTYDETSTWTIEYEAVSTKDTVFNPMNHVYFNLNRDNKVVDNHVLSSEKLHMFPLGENNMPELKPIDLVSKLGKQEIQLNDIFNSNDTEIQAQAQKVKGLDHPFEVKDGYFNLSNDILTLHVRTDMPQVVIFTLNDTSDWKSPMNIYKAHSGITLETQSMPNDIHLFGEEAHSILKADTPYYSKTSYQIEAKPH
ncbi:aldose epimerase family protein [Staphylococcus canis]|uniref:Galactose mutarotase n=1 Tax=Staphylococcus canis TaxID=2724942 RepID=A0ABS0T6A7_9STAP|nr:aldose epimerase family protein [Staphylococcus canis]MBI5974281.1 galactose mutarotase [Staphylococcus canis]